MILTELDNAIVYRMHTPKWASLPVSGAGAAKHGGRANRPGIAALYLAFEVETAIQEYKQVSTLLGPGTLVTYGLSVAPIIDFRKGYQSELWSPLWEEFFCDWRELWFNQRIEPPSWVLGDAAIKAGCKGVIFPSRVCPGGNNVVIYCDQLQAADKIEVYDPTGSLPKNQDSWA